MQYVNASSSLRNIHYFMPDIVFDIQHFKTVFFIIVNFIIKSKFPFIQKDTKFLVWNATQTSLLEFTNEKNECATEVWCQCDHQLLSSLPMFGKL